MTKMIQKTNAQILLLDLPLNCQTITNAHSRQYGAMKEFLLCRGRLVKKNFNVTKIIYYSQVYFCTICLY